MWDREPKPPAEATEGGGHEFGLPAARAKGRPMTQGPESHPSVTVYTPARLALYDLFILGFSCRFVWRCPKRHFLALYDRYASARHLDVGVGTGYFLDRCRFPAERPQITLLDLSEACLSKASRRLARYAPRVVKANVLGPLRLRRAERSSALPPRHARDEGGCLPEPEAVRRGRWRRLREHDPRPRS